MHKVKIRQKIIDRVIERRGRYHLFDSMDITETAFVIIEMHNMFCEPQAPAEVPKSRGICPNINRLCIEFKAKGGLVIWITSASTYVN